MFCLRNVCKLPNLLRFDESIPVDQEYVSGAKLFGDDMNEEEIVKWYEQESHGYSDLMAQRPLIYRYPYVALNERLFWSRLPPKRFEHLLGFGSAYGHELLPVAEQANRITIMDPGDGFSSGTVLTGRRVDYVKPTLVGDLPFDDCSFDLITCFSVLHHVPNVSHVLREFFRCSKKGAYVLLREPTTSLGGWWRPRTRLTPNERGIPLEIMRRILKSVGFKVDLEKRCMTTLTPRVKRITRLPGYNSRVVVRIDAALTLILLWNRVYHPQNVIEKLRPGAVAYILRRL